jgi:hypothetical protein
MFLERRVFASQTAIIKEGAPDTHLFFILSGDVHLTHTVWLDNPQGGPKK